jgi:hypothetical protein
MSVVRVTFSASSLSGSNILFYFRVLMLRRKASPTQTELRLEHSQMIKEALELIEVGLHSKGTSDACTSLDAHASAQP